MTKVNQGILQAQFNVKNSIDVHNAFDSEYTGSPLLKSVEGSGEIVLTDTDSFARFAANTSLEHLDPIKSASQNAVDITDSLHNNPNLKYVKLDGNFNSDVAGKFDGNSSLQKVDLTQNITVKPEDFKGNENLKTLPKLDYSNPDLTDIITNDTNLLPTTFDISDEPNTNKLGIHGDSTHQLGNLEFVKVNPESPFDNQITPQIDVSYTSLNQNGLVNLFNTMPYNVGYTVVGSPTIVDGVASGFNASNYILIDDSFSTTRDWSLENAFTFTTPTSNTYLAAIGDTFQLGLLNNGTNQIFLNINGTEYDSGLVDFTVGNKYFIKVSYSDGKYTIYFKEDNGLDYSVLYTITASAITSDTIKIGMYDSVGFNSSIDLNNTSIIIDSQVSTGPVNYTVVGNPTIVDGVISDCTSSNYIKTSSGNISSSSGELGFILTTQSVAPEYWIPVFTGTDSMFDFTTRIEYILDSGSRFRIYWPGLSVWQLYGIPLSLATKYKVIFSWTQTSLTFSLQDITNGGEIVRRTKQLDTEQSSITFVQPQFCRGNSFGTAKLDLNETYIKINGKLWFGHESKQVTWFNGKPSQIKVVDVSGATGTSSLTNDDKAIVTNKGWSLVTDGSNNKNYTIEDGKLVDADPRIWLQSDDTIQTYIDSGLKSQNFSEIECTYQIMSQTKLYACIFGGRQGTTNNEIDWRRLDNRNKFTYGNSNFYYTPTEGMFDKHTVRYTNGIVYLDNAPVILDIPQTAFLGTQNVYLFAMNDNGELQSAAKVALKIHNAKFYIDNNLVRNFVPVPAGLVIGNFVVPSNGMFDIVNQQFYANQGTGQFTYGWDL